MIKNKLSTFTHLKAFVLALAEMHRQEKELMKLSLDENERLRAELTLLIDFCEWVKNGGDDNDVKRFH